MDDCYNLGVRRKGKRRKGRVWVYIVNSPLWGQESIPHLGLHSLLVLLHHPGEGCLLHFFIVVIVHSCDFDGICIVGKVVTINIFDSVPEAIIIVESRVFVVGISKWVDMVDDVG